GNELYRRSRNYFNEKNGNGLCSGTMYWQFNDLWQAPTWATIEYGGKWKLSHYFVKRSYANLHLTPVLNGSLVTIHAISDHMMELSSNFDVKIFSYDSLVPRFNRNYRFTIEALIAKPVVSISLDEIKKESECEFNKAQSCVMILTSNEDIFVHKEFINFLLFNIGLAKVNNLKASKLKVENVRQIDRNGNFLIDLSSDQVSLFVWLDINTDKFKGIFSDNGFHMVDSRKRVAFKTNNYNIHEEDIYKYLTVQSL
ncbi:beta-mannosidase, partial [Brachionus plicatilis]